MQTFAVFLAFIALASAYPGIRSNEIEKWLMQEDAFRSIDLQDTRIERKAKLSDLKIYLYTRRNKDNPVLIENSDIATLVSSGFFNSSARTISITHGWRDDIDSEINPILIDAILETYDMNLLVSDWGSIAHLDYFTAKSAIPSLGSYLGSFIDAIVSSYGISYQQFTLIGHSLGAHISGAAGSATKEKVDLIIGLDAAQPFFTIKDINKRLDTSDANFVQAIHTAGGFLAFKIPIGHSDYFPNGGCTQPGCGILISCSHLRSYKYLAESISSDQKFWSYACKDYNTFKKGGCTTKENQSFMGTLEPDRNATGSYYLTTNSKSPYAKDINPKNDYST